MCTPNEPPFTEPQVEALRAAFQQGASNASAALNKWFGRPAMISLESIDQVPLSEATGLLGMEGPVCFGSMRLPPELPGQLLMAFDEASGLAMVDMVLGQPSGTASQWGELEESAALESTNILCCAYLNALVSQLEEQGRSLDTLVPAPPEFRRDFAASLLEFALMGQAIASEQVFLVRTNFQLDGEPLNWTLLWVPEPAALARLRDVV